MKVIDELLPGCFLLSPLIVNDMRGLFKKTYSTQTFSNLGLSINWVEDFYTVSAKNVVRGMHFVEPPYEQDKLVYCLNGSITDVLLDLRTGDHYGKSISIELSASEGNMIYIQKGVAHGFLSHVDNAIVGYKTNSKYVPSYDSGILWNSFGYKWQLAHPILSERDRALIDFSKFISPF